MAVEIAGRFLDERLRGWAQQKPLVLGISGPQGGGKSYLAAKLLEHLAQKHPQLRSVGVSIDDFYLTHAQQQQVSAAARRSGNFVLEGRGLPGTHDVALAVATMRKLAGGQACHVPVYDKSAYGGAGDRAPEQQWQRVAAGVDVVIFEGWFTGFAALDDATLTAAYWAADPASDVRRSSLPHLQEINGDLRHYEALWRSFDYFVFLQAQDLDYIYHWRQQQETQLKAAAGSGMSDVQVRAFVRRYMPMYQLYYWRMCRRGCLPAGRNLRIEVDLTRAVVASDVV